MERLPVRKNIRLWPTVYRSGNAFSITISTHQRYPWFRLHPQLADAAVETLRSLGPHRASLLHAWCIMPDHVHLLLQDKDVVEFVRVFKGKMTAIALAREPGRRLWQRSFYDHVLRKEENLVALARYIWENPVRTGLVGDPRKHRWSGSEVWPEWRALYGRG